MLVALHIKESQKREKKKEISREKEKERKSPSASPLMNRRSKNNLEEDHWGGMMAELPLVERRVGH